MVATCSNSTVLNIGVNMCLYVHQKYFEQATNGIHSSPMLFEAGLILIFLTSKHIQYH